MDTGFSPELSTLIHLSNRQMTPGQIDQVRHALTGSFNWDLFIKLVKFHRTCAPVYRNLTFYFLKEIPPGALRHLKQQNFRRIAKGFKYSGEIIKLAAVFKRKGIPVLFYKGICLSKLLYNDPVERLSGDLDLLISPERLKNAEKILYSQGYIRIDPPLAFNDADFGRYKKNFIHSAYRSPDNILVELHWQLCFLKELCPTPFETLWQKKQYVSINGSDIPTLDNLHTAVLLFVHGGNHTWQRLFWLNDIAALYENIDPEFLADTARKNGVGFFLAQAFLLLNQWYGVPLPGSLHHDQRIKFSLKIVHALYRSETRPVIILLGEAQKIVLYGWYHRFLYARARLRAKYNKKSLAIDGESELFGHLKKRLSL